MNDAKRTDEFLDGLLDKDAFARHVMGVVRGASPGCEPTYDPLEFEIQMPDGGFYLGNLHGEYALLDRDGRAGFLSRLPRAVAELARFEGVPASYGDVARRLYPVVASRAGIETDRLRRKADAEMAMPFGLASEHVAIGLAVDRPATFADVSGCDLRQWGVGFDVALAAAKANLRATNRRLWRKARRGLYVAEASWDDYTASALLLPDLFAGLDVRGDVVALAPWRGLLMATGSRDIDGLREMASLSLGLIDHPRAIWPAPLLLKGGEWIPFIPDCDPGARDAFEILAGRAVARDYGRQAHALRKAAHSATPMPQWPTLDAATGRHTSVTPWARQPSPVLLPKADVVALADVDPLTGRPVGPLVLARWDELAAVVGSRLQRMPQYYPVRYLAVDFPSDGEIRRLGAAAAP